MYDVIVVGAGIAGIHVASTLSKYHHVLLIESNPYLGGRIYTHKIPHYEVGAGRFNVNHKILISLLKKHHLTSIPLNSHFEYLEMPDAEEYYLSTMKKLIDVKLTPDLYDISFYNYCKESLTQKEVNLLIHIFGYYSEFKTMNAYDAIQSFRHDFLNQSYFTVKEGLSELCNRMIEDTKVEVRLNTLVKKIYYKDGLYHVNDEITKKLVLAIPPGSLRDFPLLKPIFPLLKGIVSCSLMRIYAIYDEVWFKGMPRMTTSSLLRHIIPIDEKTGLIMISYVDGEDLRPFMNGDKLKPKSVIKSMIQKELHRLFPDKKIHNPSYFRCHYWEVGTHALKPKYPDYRKEYVNPMKNLYLCGEAYSHRYAWMEGALESATEVLRKIESTY